MFPVPEHLPRTGGDNLSSEVSEQDPVLDLLKPLTSRGESSKFTGVQVKGVRESLEKAVNDNKGKAHQLVINNFPSISSQIQLSTSLQSDISNFRNKVSSLEAEIDHSDSQTSFLPPLITSLNRHFSASSSRSAAQAHVTALKTLSKHTERIRKLEEAVWCGRGADEWVLGELLGENGFVVGEDEREGEEILRGTKIMNEINAKEQLLRSMVVEQLTEGFNTAIAFSQPTPGRVISLTVQSEVTLQHPRTTPPPQLKPATSSHYPLTAIYSALFKLDLLEELLTTLSRKLHRDIIQPTVSSTHRISLSSTDKLSLLRLESSPNTTPQEVLECIKTILTFTSNTIFPSSNSVDLPERRPFISLITSSAFQSILDFLILPSLPPTLSGVQEWLINLQEVVEVETSFSQDGIQLIRPFFEKEAGSTWAQQRRYAVADEVRRLILGGWGGWESIEKEVEREVITYVEVEVEVEDQPMSVDVPQRDGEEDFGWGFEDSSSPKTEKIAPKADIDMENQERNGEDVNMDDDGWGFDKSTSAKAGPSSPPKAAPAQPVDEQKEEDGWDLDPSPSASTPISVAEPENLPEPTPAPIPKPAKPAREAKRLGKKVAKVKHEEEYDPWASPDPDPGEGVKTTTNGITHHQKASPVKTPKVPTPPVEATQDKGDDGWGWDDDPAPAPSRTTVPEPSGTIPTVNEPPQPKTRKEIREEKSIVKDHYLVSTSCDTLVGIAKSILKDIEDLGSLELPSPSFTSSTLQPILLESIKEVFISYRALLPTHFANQLRDVPNLAMQVFNDCIYLSDLTSQLAVAELEGEKERLLDLSEHVFESLIGFQRDSMMESLDEMDGLQGTHEDRVFKRDERTLKGLVGGLESLDRVIRPVLPSSKRLEITSYLTSSLIHRLTNDVLGLEDITEVESNRLTELFKLVYPLEHLFDGDGGVVRWVGGGWLKFCYISEILQASLVDITYLIDSGSLIDFTPDELTGLVRALFAHSEKRDSVIERIERGNVAIEG
ncbi:hypothetical protein I302_103446 [Kwoniella bestiolae CBS 10118]|uniref:ZW10 C-terminal helical domain-containing protein n=1 Tax=Kwoniella bestiolae CBS 10118 TaxID=1296100 RepID=A0A1B9G8E2_9TREE|nr:hypothetical protein I302_02146 [Kwoniella bestiolae CBS 10118]OCF27305.1 hypothetical protein I302_02146 [Kwoniella bestiolae CBS 10118]